MDESNRPAPPCPHCGRLPDEAPSSDAILMKVPHEVYPHLKKVYELMVRHGGRQVSEIFAEALVESGLRKRRSGED